MLLPLSGSVLRSSASLEAGAEYLATRSASDELEIIGPYQPFPTVRVSQQERAMRYQKSFLMAYLSSGLLTEDDQDLLDEMRQEQGLPDLQAKKLRDDLQKTVWHRRAKLRYQEPAQALEPLTALLGDALDLSELTTLLDKLDDRRSRVVLDKIRDSYVQTYSRLLKFTQLPEEVLNDLLEKLEAEGRIQALHGQWQDRFYKSSDKKQIQSFERALEALEARGSTVETWACDLLQVGAVLLGDEAPGLLSRVRALCGEVTPDNDSGDRKVQPPIEAEQQVAELGTTVDQSGKVGVWITHDDKEHFVGGKTVAAFYGALLRFLVDRSLIPDELLPVRSGWVRHLLAKQPIHQNQQPFNRPVTYQGYYMEASQSRANAITFALMLCEELELTARPRDGESVSWRRPSNIELVVDINGEPVEGGNVREFLSNIVGRLDELGLLTDALIPFPLGPSRYLLNREPRHPPNEKYPDEPDGRPFHGGHEVLDGLWIEHTLSYQNALRAAQRLVEAALCDEDIEETAGDDDDD